MDSTDDFYFVLPSNSSMLYYNDNTTACFTTQLSREIRLTGDWSVGLAEIHVPCTIIPITESEAFFTFKGGDEVGEKKISFKNDVHYFPYGVYETVEQLAVETNSSKRISKH